MPSPDPRKTNGHRRRQVRARVLAEEHDCWICGQPVDKTLGLQPGVHSRRCDRPDCNGCVPHPAAPEVDEIIPVSKGGNPYDRSNCRLSHRLCNVRRGNGDRPIKANQPLATSRDWTAKG